MSCQYSLFSAVAVVDVLCPGPTSCHPLLCLGTPSPAVPGGQAWPRPWAFPLRSLRSDRALAALLTGSPVPVPSQALQLLLSDLVEVPRGRPALALGPLALGSWPQTLSQGQLQSEQGWVSSSIPTGWLVSHMQ